MRPTFRKCTRTSQDASKIKPFLRASVACYDLRNPANRLVADLEAHCSLFKGRVDSTSKTLSKRSTYLFLANQVRQMLKELLAGSYGIADVHFEQRAIELLSTEEQYAGALSKYSEYVSYLTDRLRIWAEVSRSSRAALKRAGSPF